MAHEDISIPIKIQNHGLHRIVSHRLASVLVACATANALRVDESRSYVAELHWRVYEIEPDGNRWSCCSLVTLAAEESMNLFRFSRFKSEMPSNVEKPRGLHL